MLDPNWAHRGAVGASGCFVLEARVAHGPFGGARTAGRLCGELKAAEIEIERARCRSK